MASNSSTLEADKVSLCPANLRESSFEASDIFPCMIRNLSMKENKEFGKHIISIGAIDIGQMVITSPSFASIEYLICRSKQGCFTCGKVTTSEIQCVHCMDVRFCSRRCEINRTHRTICNPMFERRDCTTVRLTTEIILAACNTVGDITALLEFCRGILFLNKKYNSCRSPYSQYAEVLTLKGKPEAANSLIAQRVVKYLFQLPQLQSSSLNAEDKKRILFSMAYRHANTISLNSFEEEKICSKGGVCVRRSIFDVLCRLNHSCDPNVEHYIDDDYVTYCVAVRPIKAGEQLFINYVSTMKWKSSLERKNYLKETWEFDCQCHLCCSKLR